MGYETLREKAKKFIENNIVPAVVAGKEVDFYLVVKAIQDNTGANEQLVEGVIRDLCSLKKLKEVRYLTIPDEKIPDWLQLVKKNEDIAKKEVDEVLEREIVDGK